MGPLPDVVDGRDGVGEVGARSILDEVVSLTGELFVTLQGLKDDWAVSLSLICFRQVYMRQGALDGSVRS